MGSSEQVRKNIFLLSGYGWYDKKLPRARYRSFLPDKR
jgi:hypothetical protein